MQVVSVLLAGAAVGSLSGSSLANQLGRKNSLLLTALPLLAGAALSATAKSLEGMLAGRIIAGIGIGLSSALVPLYISEVRSPAAVPCFGTLLPCCRSSWARVTGSPCSGGGVDGGAVVEGGETGREGGPRCPHCDGGWLTGWGNGEDSLEGVSR